LILQGIKSLFIVNDTFHIFSICIFDRQIDKLQDELSKLEKVFISVTAMTELYREEYQKIAQSDANNVSQQSNYQSLNISTTKLDSVIQSEDNVIYDNLVIRYM